MSSNEFRVGQRVVCVDASDVGRWVTEGATYTVSDVEKGSDGVEYVYVKEAENQIFWPSRFVAAPLPPIGSRVRVTEAHHLWDADEILSIDSHDIDNPDWPRHNLTPDCKASRVARLGGSYHLDSTKVEVIPGPEVPAAPVSISGEPGRAYLGTVGEYENVLMMRTTNDLRWITTDPRVCEDDDRPEPTDVRAVVVLDLSAKGDLTGTITALREDGWPEIADQIAAQIAPPKVRMKEPGLWGVVEGHLHGEDSSEFVNTKQGWVNTADGSEYVWESILDPTLIRDGVTS